MDKYFRKQINDIADYASKYIQELDDPLSKLEKLMLNGKTSKEVNFEIERLQRTAFCIYGILEDMRLLKEITREDEEREKDTN